MVVAVEDMHIDSNDFIGHVIIADVFHIYRMSCVVLSTLPYAR